MAIFVLEALDLDEILEAVEAFVVEPFGVDPSAADLETVETGLGIAVMEVVPEPVEEEAVDTDWD